MQLHQCDKIFFWKKLEVEIWQGSQGKLLGSQAIL